MFSQASVSHSVHTGGVGYLWSHVPCGVEGEGRVSLVQCSFWEIGYLGIGYLGGSVSGW